MSNLPKNPKGKQVITTITGKNEFMISQRVSALIDDFLKTETDLALERIDAAETSLEAILDAVQSVPFLASKKMVVVRELSSNKPAAESIEHIISSTSPTTDFIIIESSPDKRTVYYKTLKSLTTLEEYEELDGMALAKWLVEKAKNQSANLSTSDANYLIDRVGQNQLLLFNELQKLITYSDKITRETIDLLTEKTPQSKIFDLLDATFAGNKARALELYEEQRSLKVEPQAIMALLTWQLQLISLAKLGTGKSSTQIASDSKLNPYPIQKAQNLAAKISGDKLSQMISDALDIDYKSKTIAFDLDEALKTYIVTL